jgi:hypothetical protein
MSDYLHDVALRMMDEPPGGNAMITAWNIHSFSTPHHHEQDETANDGRVFQKDYKTLHPSQLTRMISLQAWPSGFFEKP